MKKVVLVALAILTSCLPAAAAEEKKPAKLIYALVYFTALENVTHDYPTTTLATILEMVPDKKFNGYRVCKSKVGSYTYVTYAYRAFSHDPMGYRLVVGQLQKTGFFTIINMAIPENKLDIAMHISQPVPFRINVTTSSEDEEFRIYLATFEKGGVFQKMECTIANNVNDLNQFLKP